MAVTDSLHLNAERYKHMYDVRPVACLVNNLLVIIRETEIVLVAQRLEYRNMELFCSEITICQIVLNVLWSVPTENFHFMTSFSQLPCKTLGGDGGSVIRRVKTVNYEYNFHKFNCFCELFFKIGGKSTAL
jgi:hypothetical protein